MKYIIFIYMILFTIITDVVFAEYYKYIDESGRIKYTDDISKIPDSYREQAQTFKEYKSNTTKHDVKKEKEQIPESVSGKDAESQNDKQLKVRKQMQTELDKEYESLIAIEKKLMEEKAHLKTREDFKAYNEKIKNLNTQIDIFEKKRVSFEKTLSR